MTILIMCMAFYGVFMVAYQVTDIILDATALVNKMGRAADSLNAMPTPPVFKQTNTIERKVSA